MSLPKISLSGLAKGALCIGIVCLPTAPAHAQIFDVAVTQGEEIIKAMQPVLITLGVLGVLGVGAMAMAGKMPWGWAFALLGGLSLLYLAEPIRDWIVNDVAKSPAGDAKAIGDAIATANSDVANDTKNLLYPAAIAILAAVGALSAMGRFQWRWVFAAIGGMLIIASAEPITQMFYPGTGTPNPAIFQQSEQLIDNTAKRIQYLAMGAGGLGAIGAGTVAYMGRLQWPWMYAIGGGLAAVGGADYMTQYVTGEAVLTTNQN